MKQNKPGSRCATCPRWDRWHIRIPNPKDQQKLIELYQRSGAKTKSDFLRARLLDESFKVITMDKSSELYPRALGNIIPKSDSLTTKLSRRSIANAVKKNSSKNGTPARNLLRSHHQITSTSDTANRRFGEKI